MYVCSDVFFVYFLKWGNVIFVSLLLTFDGLCTIIGVW